MGRKILNSVVREALNEKVTFESTFEGDEGMIREDKCGKSILGQEERKTCSALKHIRGTARKLV